jgi:hypothetical protein
VSERSEPIATTIERSNHAMVSFLGDIRPDQLAIACADDGGETIGAIVAHLAEGYEQILGWIQRSTGGPVSPPPAPRVRTDIFVGQVARLGQLGVEWAALVRGLTNEQLDLVPPATTGITDGSLTLGSVMDELLEHQRLHLTYIDKALGELGSRARYAP